MKRVVAACFSAIIMMAMLWAALRPSNAPNAIDRQAGAFAGPAASARPAPLPAQDGELQGAATRIDELLASARRGDVAAYLSSFGGSLRARLEREAGERGRGAFAAELRRAAGARKSHAIFAPEPGDARGDSADVVIEAIYRDRVERQTYRLGRAGTDWLINSVETVRARAPTVPVGSLATYREPEGVPVATHGPGVLATDERQ